MSCEGESYMYLLGFGFCVQAIRVARVDLANGPLVTVSSSFSFSISMWIYTLSWQWSLSNESHILQCCHLWKFYMYKLKSIALRLCIPLFWDSIYEFLSAVLLILFKIGFWIKLKQIKCVDLFLIFYCN